MVQFNLKLNKYNKKILNYYYTIPLYYISTVFHCGVSDGQCNAIVITKVSIIGNFYERFGNA